jgi:hypothetical protein
MPRADYGTSLSLLRPDVHFLFLGLDEPIWRQTPLHNRCLCNSPWYFLNLHKYNTFREKTTSNIHQVPRRRAHVKHGCCKALLLKSTLYGAIPFREPCSQALTRRTGFSKQWARQMETSICGMVGTVLLVPDTAHVCGKVDPKRELWLLLDRHFVSKTKGLGRDLLVILLDFRWRRRLATRYRLPHW